MPASESNPERQVSLHVGHAAAAIVSAGEGFVPSQTLSRRSLGSLEHCCMDWNGADMSEVSSANPHSRPHPAGPSMLAQKIHTVKVVVMEVDKTAEVITFFPLFSDFCKTCISPVPEIRVE